MTHREGSEVALVTGVGRREGIGFAVCRALAQKGLKVLLTARDAGRAQALAATLSSEGFDVRGFALDVTNAQSVAGAAAQIQRGFGRLDVLINNAAGMAAFGERADAADLAVAHEVIETTLFGAWRLSQALLPLLRAAAPGRLVNVSSGAGSHGDSVFGMASDNNMGTSYAVAKAALNALTAKLAHEDKASGVRINAVCPGFTATFPGAEAMGARPVADGAASVVWAAMLGRDGPSGGFFRDGQRLAW